MKYSVDRNGEMLGEPVYAEKLTMDVTERPEDFLKEASQLEFFSAKQLKEYIEKFKGSGRKQLRRLWVEFHYKVSLPFISFVVMLLGAPLAMSKKRSSAMIG